MWSLRPQSKLEISGVTLLDLSSIDIACLKSHAMCLSVGKSHGSQNVVVRAAGPQAETHAVAAAPEEMTAKGLAQHPSDVEAYHTFMCVVSFGSLCLEY